MKPFQISLINGIILIAMSLWGYFSSETPSNTALIPAVFGLIFLLVTPAFRKENKVVAHIVVVLTLLLILALVMPLRGAIGRGDTMAIVRVGTMIGVSLIAMVIYIQSFIAAKKARG